MRRIQKILKAKKKEWFPKGEKGKSFAYLFERLKIGVSEGFGARKDDKERIQGGKKEERRGRDSQNGRGSLRSPSPKEAVRVEEKLVGPDENGVSHGNGNAKGAKIVEANTGSSISDALVDWFRKASGRRREDDVEARVEK